LPRNASVSNSAPERGVRLPAQPADSFVHAFCHTDAIEVLEERDRHSPRRRQRLARSRECERLWEFAQQRSRLLRSAGEQHDVAWQSEDRAGTRGSSELLTPEPERGELRLLGCIERTPFEQRVELRNRRLEIRA
jgi:hypothetical protein